MPVPAGDQRFSFAPSSLQPAAPCTISIATSRVVDRGARRRVAVRTRSPAASRRGYGSANGRAQASQRTCGGEVACRSGYASSKLSVVSGVSDSVSASARGGRSRRHALMRNASLFTTPRMKSLHAIAAWRRVARDAANGRAVVVLHASANRVRHQVLRERANERRRTLEQRALQLGRDSRPACRRRAAPRVSSGAPFSRMRHWPVTSKLSSARPIGSMYW